MSYVLTTCYTDKNTREGDVYGKIIQSDDQIKLMKEMFQRVKTELLDILTVANISKSSKTSLIKKIDKICSSELLLKDQMIDTSKLTSYDDKKDDTILIEVKNKKRKEITIHHYDKDFNGFEVYKYKIQKLFTI